MDFRQHFRMAKTPGLNVAALINIVFLLFLFFIVTPLFTGQPPMKVKLPGAVTSDIVNDVDLTIVVSSENIFFYNNRVVTLTELKELLSRPQHRRAKVLIKADRRASLGRIVDLWNLGRSLGVERIDVASDREE